jgi:hypothetical protein
MPKPILAQPGDAPTLSVAQWYSLLPNGHQFFATPRPLTPTELAAQRRRYAAWLTDLQHYLKAHPHDPSKRSTIDVIREWAEVRGIAIENGQSEWPGVDYSGEHGER